jgi:hypothetical protein
VTCHEVVLTSFVTCHAIIDMFCDFPCSCSGKFSDMP